jgi:hypothetical protein
MLERLDAALRRSRQRQRRAWGSPLVRRPRGDGEEMSGPAGVVSALEVHRQLGGDLTHT